MTEATQVSTREFLIATYALASFRAFAAQDEAIELAKLIEMQFASLPDSPQQKTTLDLVASVRQRLQMLGSEIDLTTYTPRWAGAQLTGPARQSGIGRVLVDYMRSMSGRLPRSQKNLQ